MASGEELNHKTSKTRLECKSVMCVQVLWFIILIIL